MGMIVYSLFMGNVTRTLNFNLNYGDYSVYTIMGNAELISSAVWRLKASSFYKNPRQPCLVAPCPPKLEAEAPSLLLPPSNKKKCTAVAFHDPKP